LSYKIVKLKKKHSANNEFDVCMTVTVKTWRHNLLQEDGFSVPLRFKSE